MAFLGHSVTGRQILLDYNHLLLNCHCFEKLVSMFVPMRVAQTMCREPANWPL
jgi:hypothetical protein